MNREGKNVIREGKNVIRIHDTAVLVECLVTKLCLCVPHNSIEFSNTDRAPPMLLLTCIEMCAHSPDSMQSSLPDCQHTPAMHGPAETLGLFDHIAFS